MDSVQEHHRPHTGTAGTGVTEGSSSSFNQSGPYDRGRREQVRIRLGRRSVTPPGPASARQSTPHDSG